ncbi:lysophospholipid acyltransferase family protein [Prescottella agglutinans]|uniref:1-acyl-sn-glycerol-3-phosphate acyltransferase n=1 Tax=Prescottella agglutinans TaxID=1644129 RepID=A0ABT6M3S1_9NOCA|nr:lysophospholipid acyltransferase family protein [Prescottella agglutinans]MDH6278953.1 1-acyl-sn-glycerol-3-phosphate acyltransferase [Prescottella agglutinans]
MNEVAKVIPLHGGVGARPARDRGTNRHSPSPAGRRPLPEPAVDAAGKAAEDAAAEATESVAEEAAGEHGGSPLDALRSHLVDQVTGVAGFLRRRIAGDYEVDEFGYDPHFADGVFLPALRPLFEKWFRVEVRGVENIPAQGGALIVANHAGVVPIDALMTSVAVHDHHPQHRALRMLAADLAFEMPVIGNIARKAGHTLACHPDAERLLRGGEVAAVFPEGYKGIGKPFSERYKLQRFGRGGFVSAAMRAGAPIIPCSIVGSEEIYPKIGDIAPLARLLDMPYFPVTPLFPHLGPLGLVPLPSKWYIEFGTPIVTDTYDAAEADDPMVLFEVTDHVRETIQQTLYRLLAQRRNVFMG